MTADVNVTEKVARALYPSVFDPSGRCWQHFGQTAEAAREDAQGEAMDEARKALAALSDPEVLAGMAEVLAAHTGWAQVSGDGGEFRLICHDCGEDLGAERIVVAEWVGRTGKDPAEWNRRGKVPAYDEAQAAHQAAALAGWLKGQG